MEIVKWILQTFITFALIYEVWTIKDRVVELEKEFAPNAQFQKVRELEHDKEALEYRNQTLVGQLHENERLSNENTKLKCRILKLEEELEEWQKR